MFLSADLRKSIALFEIELSNTATHFSKNIVICKAKHDYWGGDYWGGAVQMINQAASQMEWIVNGSKSDDVALSKLNRINNLYLESQARADPNEQDVCTRGQDAAVTWILSKMKELKGHFDM